MPSKNKTKQIKEPDHPLLHHPVRWDEVMHMITGVTSFYIFAIAFAFLGFAGGYSLGLNQNASTTAPETSVDSVDSMRDSEEVLNLTEEDVEVFLQELIDEEAEDTNNNTVTEDEMPMPEENTTAPQDTQQQDTVETDETSFNRPALVNENQVQETLTQEDSLTLNETAVSSSSSNSLASSDGSLSFYSMMISLGGTVYALNLFHEEDEE